MTVRQGNALGIPEPSGAVDAVLYADHRLRLTYRPAPGPALVRLSGEIDATNRAALEETLARAGYGGDRLLIDAGRLRFIDTGGMRLLARLWRTGAVRLIHVPPCMRRLADLLDLPLRDDALDGVAEDDLHPPRQG
ncbi:STAS domain-containing protein [Planomonospora alba]|uniref:STAS domain-containing protein n=1 Tax=Planomonospora alba TaxID=161354 RepID=UPI0031EE4D40